MRCPYRKCRDEMCLTVGFVGKSKPNQRIQCEGRVPNPGCPAAPQVYLVSEAAPARACVVSHEQPM